MLRWESEFSAPSNQFPSYRKQKPINELKYKYGIVLKADVKNSGESIPQLQETEVQ
jgi:hypothetical protein